MSYEKEFELPFGVIKFDAEFVKYNELYVEYNKVAHSTAMNFLLDIKQKHSDMKSLIEHCESELLTQLKPYIDKTVNKLIDEDFYDVNTTHFIENFYQRDYYFFNTCFNDIEDKYYEITLKKEQLDEYRTARRQNRGRVIGGGFGVSGAIQGMAMAGAANLAAGAAIGTFNLIGSAISSIKQNSQLRDLYNSDSLDHALYNAVYWSIFNLHYAFRDAYQYFKKEPYGRLPTDDEKNRSSRLVDNLKTGRIPSDKIANILCEAISLNPYNKELYIYSITKYMDYDSSITTLGNFLSVDIEDFKINQLNKVFNESKYNSEDECLELYNQLQQLVTNLSISGKPEAIKLIEQDLKKFEEDAKTVNEYLYDTREEADTARKELEWIIPALESLDKTNENDVNKLINNIKAKSIESKNSHDILHQLETVSVQLDETNRTVNNIVLPTRKEAEIARHELSWWEKKESILNSNSFQDLLILYKEAKSNNFTSTFSKEYLIAIKEKAKNIELETRTFRGTVFDSAKDANQANINFKKIEQKRQSINFDDEEQVIKWYKFLNNLDSTKTKLNKNILKDLIEEAKTKSLELDRKARTIYDIEISNRKNVELAKIEYSNIEQWHKSIDYTDEKSLLDLKNKINNEIKTEIKIPFLNLLNEKLAEIDEQERTFDDVIYETRAEAYTKKSEQINTLASKYQEIKDRGFLKSFLMYFLGFITSLVLIKGLEVIGLCIVAVMYLGWFVQRKKQKEAWKELNPSYHEGKSIFALLGFTLKWSFIILILIFVTITGIEIYRKTLEKDIDYNLQTIAVAKPVEPNTKAKQNALITESESSTNSVEETPLISIENITPTREDVILNKNIAEKPNIHINDTYILEAVDSRTPNSIISTTRTVTNIIGDTIMFSSAITNSKSGKARTLIFDSNMNLIGSRNVGGSGFDYSPPIKYFDFPLSSGKTWEQQTTETNLITKAKRIHTIFGTVGEWEDITVPAGTFRSIKISLTTKLFNPETGETVKGTDTSWYAPDANRTVLSITTNDNQHTKRVVKLVSLLINSKEFPAGLRLPTEAELSKEPLRNESPTKNATVTADFNGDGKLDYAYLLASINTSRGALAVKLSTNNEYQWKIVDNDLDWNGEPMGIDPAEPDNYETACGKGYWECGKNEPKSIALKNAGLWYFPYEKGGAVLIYWDNSSNDFKQATLND